MKQHLSHGQTVEEAFESLTAKQRGDKALGKVLERPSGQRAATFVESYEGSTNGEWLAVPVAYVESRDYKKEKGIAKQRAQVFLFFTT